MNRVGLLNISRYSENKPYGISLLILPTPRIANCALLSETNASALTVERCSSAFCLSTTGNTGLGPYMVYMVLEGFISVISLLQQPDRAPKSSNFLR